MLHARVGAQLGRHKREHVFDGGHPRRLQHTHRRGIHPGETAYTRHFMNRSSPSRVHVEVTLRATSRRATGMAMFTVVQKIALLGLLLLTNPQVRTPRPGSTRWGCRGGACYFRW